VPEVTGKQRKGRASVVPLPGRELGPRRLSLPRLARLAAQGALSRAFRHPAAPGFTQQLREPRLVSSRRRQRRKQCRSSRRLSRLESSTRSTPRATPAKLGRPRPLGGDPEADAEVAAQPARLGDVAAERKKAAEVRVADEHDRVLRQRLRDRVALAVAERREHAAAGCELVGRPAARQPTPHRSGRSVCSPSWSGFQRPSSRSSSSFRFAHS
jgi:hypothetical protein